jgi:hypothetical protein
MLRLRLILLCACLASAGAPASIASAQEATNYPTGEAEQMMARFSQCIVRTANARALHRFLRIVPTDPAFQIEGRRLARDLCAPRVPGGVTRLSFRLNLFRSALYSALYRRDFGASVPPDLSSVPPLTFSSEFDGPAADIPAGMRILRALGDCAARGDARSVHALLMTEIGSREEQPAIAAVLPAMQHCLPENQQLGFGRGMLRGILAEALYKLRSAASPPAASR